MPAAVMFTFDLHSVIIEKRAKNLKIVLLKLNIRILTTFEIFGAAEHCVHCYLPLWFRSYQLYTSLFCCVNMGTKAACCVTV